MEKSSAISEKDKTSWKECLVEQLISSEESDDDGSFVIHSLPWRSEKVDNFFSGLDRKSDKKKTKKSKMMTFQRIKGLRSNRPRPSLEKVPEWALNPSH